MKTSCTSKSKLLLMYTLLRFILYIWYTKTDPFNRNRKYRLKLVQSDESLK